VTGTDDWDAITRRHTEDLLVYLALGRFRRRPPISALPVGLQRDIRSFFGSYANARRLADDRLFQASDAEAVDDACRRSAVGKMNDAPISAPDPFRSFNSWERACPV
jgi:DNA phosphorothioation-associated putative methyltransferase